MYQVAAYLHVRSIHIYLHTACVVSIVYVSGEGGKMVDRGDNTYGGKYVVNPSGGLESKGHPLGATG